MSVPAGDPGTAGAGRASHAAAPRQDLTRAVFLRLTLALTALVLVAQSAWALTTPGFRGPDEPHHVNSILRLASGGGWPDPGTALVDPAIMQATREAALITPEATGFAYVPDRYLLEDPDSGLPSWYEAPVVPQPSRSAIGSVAAADPAATVRDQMTQHPPAYYAGGAALASLLDLAERPWDRAVLTLRLYSILLTAPLVPCLVFVARRLGATRRGALFAGLLPLFIPQVTFIGAMVSNDAPAIGLGAVALAAMAWAACRRVDLASILVVGVAVGLALWTKGQVLALGLPLVLVFLLNRGNPWRWRVGGALGAGALSQIVCPWWLMNLVRYGALQPDGFQRPPLPHWDPAQADFGAFAGKALSDLMTSFTGKFGWLDIYLPMAASVALSAVLLVLVVLGALRARERAWIPLAFFGAVAGISLVLLRNAWVVYVETGQVAGVQGRYLFPFLAAWAVVALGLARWGRAGFAGWAVAAVAVNAAALGTVLRTYFPGAPLDLQRMSAVLGFDQPYVLAVLACYAVVLLAIAVGGIVLATRMGISSRRSGAPSPRRGRTRSRPS